MTEVTQDKVQISIPTDKYTKTKTAAGGASHHNGDPIAIALAGATLVQVYIVAAAMLNVEQSDLEAKYEHLNAGQQRMNLGNRIRGAVNKINGATAKIEAKNEKIEAANKVIREFNDAITVDDDGKASANAKVEKPLHELPEVEQTGEERLGEVAEPIRAEIEAAAATKLAADEAKAKAAQEKADAKAEKAAAAKAAKEAKTEDSE